MLLLVLSKDFKVLDKLMVLNQFSNFCENWLLAQSEFLVKVSAGKVQDGLLLWADEEAIRDLVKQEGKQSWLLNRLLSSLSLVRSLNTTRLAHHRLHRQRQQSGSQ